VADVSPTAYGLTWLVALVMILVVFFWGRIVTWVRWAAWRPPR
jgi:hypothetical protein